MNLDELNRNEKLRRGITTGTCAAAAAVYAYSLLSGRNQKPVVNILLPGNLKIEVPIKTSEVRGNTAAAAVEKDAGDDPDVTHKSSIIVKASFCDKNTPDEKDYLETCGISSVIIRGGEGVGFCTRPGLDVPPGKYAINPAPRRLIAENLANAGFGKNPEKALLIEINVPGGEQIARKTLNPKLGVTGGISILGVSGIVEPFSNEAYIHSIRLQIRAIAAQGITRIALSTGTRSQNSFLRDNPDFSRESCIRIGDFIADSIRAVNGTGVTGVAVACMPGKLYKYACGHEYTHAHKVKLEPGLMAEILSKAGVEGDIIGRILLADTVKEAAENLTENQYLDLLKKLAVMALRNMQKWNPETDISLHVYDSEGEFILQYPEKDGK